MITSLIVDDEHDGRVAVRNMVEKYCNSVKILDEADGVEDAFLKIKQHNPELVFLDIKMDDGTAFDLLRKFSQITFKIIFVTAYDEYAIEAIKYSALDYLLKPVRPALLVEAVEKLQENSRINKLEQQIELLLQEKQQREKIALPTSDGLLFVKVVEVLRCESDSSYTNFVLATGKKILVTRTLKEFEELLPADMFYRVHKSHLINTKYIDQYITRDGASVILENGDCVPIARNRKDEFLKVLNG